MQGVVPAANSGEGLSILLREIALALLQIASVSMTCSVALKLQVRAVGHIVRPRNRSRDAPVTICFT